NELIRSGITIGISALILIFTGPVINVDPLDDCALIILSVSSINVGMNLKLSDVIIAISWTGTLNTVNGEANFSNASVKEIGLLVSGTSVVITTSAMSLVEVYNPFRTTSSSIVNIFASTSTGPPLIKNRCIKNVKTSSTRIIFSPFKTNITPSFASFKMTSTNPIKSKYVTKLFAKNTMTINIAVAISFALASSL